jgi:tetratricopeptide (TPR) repeat protein
VGKSRLAEEIRGETDSRVLRATSEAYTSSTPYVAWRDVLRELVGVGWEDPSDLVIDSLRDIVENRDPALLPWLPLIAAAADAEMPPTPEVSELGPEFVRPRLHETVARFLRAAITEPTVVEFEDAHLMDEASAELLDSVASDDDVSFPCLFLVLRRDVQPVPETSMARSVRIELEPLRPTEALRLAEVITEDAPLMDHVLRITVERAAGNPQLLLDLIRAVSSGHGSLPDSVEAAATVRIDGLALADRQLLRRAAVLGSSFHPRLLDEVLDRDVPRPDAGAWERLSEFFEHEGDGYLRFRRAVVRDAAYAGLPFRVRRRLHGAVGRRMESEAPDAEEAAGILSLHFFLAAEYEQAWRYARTAGRRAQEIYANIDAARFYRRAIEAGRKAEVRRDELLEVMEALVEVLWRASLYSEAKRASDEARRLSADDPLRQARLLRVRSQIDQAVGRLPQALRWLTRARSAVAGVRTRDARRVVAELDAQQALVLQRQGRTTEAIVSARRAIRGGRAVGSLEAMGRGENALADALVRTGRPGGVEHWQRALHHFEASGDLLSQASILSNLGVGSYFEGKWDEALGLYARAREMFERLGDTDNTATTKMNIAEVLVDQGSLQEADRLLRETIRVWRASGDHQSLAFCLTQLGRVAAVGGKPSEALDLFTQARDEYASVGASGYILEVDTAEAECLLLVGETARALELSEKVLAQQSRDEGISVLAPTLERIRGYALLQLGDQEGARAAFNASVDIARELGAENHVALSLVALARLARMEGSSVYQQLDAESAPTLERLGIRAVPAIPLARRV